MNDKITDDVKRAILSHVGAHPNRYEDYDIFIKGNDYVVVPPSEDSSIRKVSLSAIPSFTSRQ